MPFFTSTNTGLVLSDPTTQNPGTVASYATITNTTYSYNGDAVYGTNVAAWNFTNLGTISATASAANGVELRAGGSVTNAASAVINGVENGVYITGGAGTVVNSGTVASVLGYGVVLNQAGVVANGTGATISGGI